MFDACTLYRSSLPTCSFGNDLLRRMRGANSNSQQTTSAAHQPPSPKRRLSIMWLVGKRQWNELKKKLNEGEFDDDVCNKHELNRIITFCVRFNAPSDIIHLLCHLNPEALVVSTTPFCVARQQTGNVQTLIIMEGARQQAIIRKFNGSLISSSDKNLSMSSLNNNNVSCSSLTGILQVNQVTPSA